jgi:hypothetical protein
MHELLHWLPHAPHYKQGPDEAEARIEEETGNFANSELYRSRSNLGANTAPILLSAFPLPPRTTTTEFANLAQHISSKGRLRNACYIVSGDPR